MVSFPANRFIHPTREINHFMLLVSASLQAIEKRAGDRRLRSGREKKGVSPFLSQADPARFPPVFLIVPTDRGRRTRYNLGSVVIESN